MKIFCTISFLFLLFSSTAQQITHLEYFFNTDPGPGNGILIDVPDDDTLSFSFNVPLGSLPEGFHLLAVRVRYNTSQWSPYEYRSFYIAPAPITLGGIAGAEYFIDTDPGTGNGIPLSVGSPGTSVSFAPVIPAGMSGGFHFLAIRVKDQSGRWSFFEKRNFYVSPGPITMPSLTAAEYFFDVDPGPGNGTPISVGTPGSPVNFMAMIPANLGGGFHFLCIRVRDQNGIWSFIEKRNFYLSPPPVASLDITAAEYFWDVDPAPGQGIPFSVGTPGDTLTLNPLIDIAPATVLGSYTFTFRVKDLMGSWSPYQYDTVIVAISIPPNITLNAEMGACTKVVTGLDPQVLNNEPITYQLTGATTGTGNGSASGLTFNTGVTTVKYTLVNFPTAFASFTVTIVDTEFPTISCPANITVGTDPGICGAVVNYSVTFNDNCPGATLTLLSGIASGSPFPAGSTTNTFRVTDTSGYSTTCSFSITVMDNVPPALTCPSNMTVNTDPEQCVATGVSPGTPMASDNCLLASTTNNAPTSYPLGVTQVTWTATDNAGNSQSCIQAITVIDNQNPTITCPSNITVNADPGTCTKNVSFNATASDNCGIASINYSPASGSVFSVGTTIVTTTATDVNGRTSTCIFTVTVADPEPPQITCPTDITMNTDPGQCSAVVSLSALASDNCGTPIVSFIPSSGSAFPVGTTLVIATATDGGGLTSTCTFSVTIHDAQLPSITCPANLTVNMDPGLCTASNVMLGSPAVSDNCGIAGTSNNAPSSFSPGITQVLWTTTDIHGNTQACQQSVTVIDNQPPTITTCPPNVTVNNNPGQCSSIVNFTFAGSDNCVLFSIASSPFQSGESFPKGLSSVTIQATDNTGNTSTCSFTVLVLDAEAPQLTCPIPILTATSPGVCGKILNFAPTVSDNCPPSPSVVNVPASGSFFPVGTTMVTSTATDISGNSQSCTFNIVVEDEEAPVLECPAAITVNTDPGICTASGVMLGSPVLNTDNCGIASLTNNALAVYPKGVNLVTWTSTDVHGNTSTCTQNVMVIDNEPPVISCPPDMTLLAGAGPTTVVNYPAPIATDNCPGVSLMQLTGLPSGSAFPVGTTTNTFRATDAGGLTSTCVFTVTLVKGKVGINTTTPLAMLHVKDSSVLFTAPPVLPQNPGPPPIQGSGTRMMWYPAKGAFRSGTVTGLQWAKDSIGINSIAVGNVTRAPGFASAALGASTFALDSFSFAAGSFTRANGLAAAVFGSQNMVSGDFGVAFNQSNTISGSRSVAFGFSNNVSGSNSMAFGESNGVQSDHSIVAGASNIGNSFASLTMGRFADTLSASRVAWINVNPLWVAGNGTSSVQRHTAFTLLKNGNLGIGTIFPTFRFHHVTNDAGSGGIAEGVWIENTNANVGEAALSFRIAQLPPSRQWSFGVNQQPDFHFNYGPAFAGSYFKFAIDTLGSVGVRTASPLAPLHVQRNSPSGGVIHTSGLSVFESNNNLTYLFLSSQTSNETGILSGNQVTPHRCGIIFAADSTIHISSGGSSTRLFIAKNGNSGIGTSSPSAKLDVAGTLELGNTGTLLQEILKASVNIDLPSIAGNSTLSQNVAIANTNVNSTIWVSPSGSLPDGLILASAHVSIPGTVVMRILNSTGSAIDLGAMNFYFGIIR